MSWAVVGFTVGTPYSEDALEAARRPRNKHMNTSGNSLMIPKEPRVA